MNRYKIIYLKRKTSYISDNYKTENRDNIY